MEENTEKFLKFKEFYENKDNWRPPSFSQICKHMGWQSKNNVTKMLKRYDRTHFHN